MDQLKGDDRMFWRKRGGEEREGVFMDAHTHARMHAHTHPCTHPNTNTHSRAHHSLSGMPPFLQLSNGQELQSVWSKH